MEEFANMAMNFLIVATGLYFVSSSILPPANPHETFIKTMLWGAKVLVGLSMMLIPFVNEWVVRTIR